MSRLQETENPPWPQFVLRRTDQLVVAAITASSLLLVALWCAWHNHRRGRLIDIDKTPPVPIHFQLDINSANWPEIALLPNIGEQLAKRVVEDRRVNGPFHDVADLTRVRGIGPKTLDSIKPYLLPPHVSPASGATRSAAAGGAN